MEILAIEDSEIDLIHGKMKSELGLLEEEGLNISLSIDTVENLKLLNCKLNENKIYKKDPIKFMNIFHNYIANVIADYIINNKELTFLEKIIQKQYYYFNPKERKRILELSLNILNYREGFYLSTNVYKISKKVRMIEEIVNYLENNNKLIIDGFIRFRLKYYMEDLRDAVVAGVEDYIMEKEYNEFIRLLQYFVDIQEPKIQTMHILADGGNYVLMDENFNCIKNEYLEELSTEFLDGEIKYEDLLISSLITIAPTKIYIHLTEEIQNKEIIDTIKKVFSNRVIICKGCDICNRKSVTRDKSQN